MEFRGKRVKVVNRMFMDAEHSFSMLKFYYGEITNLLRMRAEDFRKSTDEIGEEHKRLQRPFDKEYWLKHYDVYSEFYPNIFSNSFIISACALFESQIQKICALVKEEHKVPLEWDDLEGNPLTRAKRFLFLGGIILKDDPPDSFQHWLSSNMPGQSRMTVRELWQELDNYFLVRNCLIHHGGAISRMRYQRRITEYSLSKRVLVDNKGQKELAMSPDFNMAVCDTMAKFFSKLMGAYYSTPLPG